MHEQRCKRNGRTGDNIEETRRNVGGNKTAPRWIRQTGGSHGQHRARKECSPSPERVPAGGDTLSGNLEKSERVPESLRLIARTERWNRWDSFTIRFSTTFEGGGGERRRVDAGRNKKERTEAERIRTIVRD